MNEVAAATPADDAGLDRWRSAFESSLVPGLGQWLLGERPLAIAMFAGGALLPWSAVPLLWNRTLPIPALLALIFVGVGFALASVMLAYRGAVKRGAPASGSTPWRGAFWSRLFPGVGQLTQRRLGASLAILAVGLLLAAFRGSIPGAIAFAALTLFAVMNALRVGGPGIAPTTMSSRLMRLFVVLILAAELAPAMLRQFVVEAVRIPSESMSPTLAPGDYFFIDKTRAGRAERGELVAYPIPQQPSARYVKRCVALGGDTLELRDKQLWINGQAVDEPFVMHVDEAIRPAQSDTRDNLGPVEIPAGQVFMLGDNRENSNDSRFTGTIALSTIRGRVLRIYWPPSRWNALRDS
jgi:signal peptidase I